MISILLLLTIPLSLSFHLLYRFIVCSLAAVIAASLARAGNTTFVGRLALELGRVVFLAIAIALSIAFSFAVALLM